ncbi:MarR family winged helix-turn-helix transcriptional regulator [Kineosporia succinea]|uniref:DNA-binding MarR family transcriptional regulator n=1 Tax=Kineosporia succinea TaxID=84632 RepID=A0ABT9PDK3_9ACTN|nr:MarR family winged helix-turn-helix transcriptional regulator [Kineosporia succinea]MDP9830474.1 DNA-binding MarR family transcriptional regulator [Kineosporia succinea]
METTPGGWSGGDPDAFMAMTLTRTALAMRKTFVAALAPFDLPAPQFSVLMNLVQNPGCSQADLARVVLATPQSVGELLRQMEHQGRVERTPPSGRGRASAVYATPAGTALLDEVTPHVLAAFSPQALGLDRQTHDRINAELHTMLRALTS